MLFRRFAAALCLLSFVGCGSGEHAAPTQAPVVVPPAVPELDERLHVGVARQEVACPAQTSHTMVALAFGQSNAANYLERPYTSASVINFHQGKCYLAKDPLLGTYGARGSLWTLLGNKLAGHFDNVILITIAVGGTTIGQWQESTWLEEGMQTPYAITHFFWHQGESDAFRTPGADYVAALRNLIGRSKAAFPDSQFWVAIASICGGVPDPEIRAGQQAVIGPGVFQGPDTDVYDKTYRWDGCHLGAVAQEAITDEWAALLTQ